MSDRVQTITSHIDNKINRFWGWVVDHEEKLHRASKIMSLEFEKKLFVGNQYLVSKDMLVKANALMHKLEVQLQAFNTDISIMQSFNFDEHDKYYLVLYGCQSQQTDASLDELLSKSPALKYLRFNKLSGISTRDGIPEEVKEDFEAVRFEITQEKFKHLSVVGKPAHENTILNFYVDKGTNEFFRNVEDGMDFILRVATDGLNYQEIFHRVDVHVKNSIDDLQFPSILELREHIINKLLQVH